MTTAEEITALLQTAKGELGTHEEDGPNIGTCAKYQEVTGGSPGDSWCADFVCWCFKQISALGLLPRITGSCEEMRQAARYKMLMVPRTEQPAAGDIGVVVNTAANHAHHMFLVEDAPNADGVFPTIEGNSNDNGSANGDGVYERNKRRVGGGGPQDHYEFIRCFIPESAAQ